MLIYLFLKQSFSLFLNFFFFLKSIFAEQTGLRNENTLGSGHQERGKLHARV